MSPIYHTVCKWQGLASFAWSGVYTPWSLFHRIRSHSQGPLHIKGRQWGEGKSEQAEKKRAKKSQKQNKKLLGTTFLQSSSKWSHLFWLLIGQKKNSHIFLPNQRAANLWVRVVCSDTVVHEGRLYAILPRLSNLSRSSEEPIHRKICTGRMYHTTVCNPRAPSYSGLKDRSLLFSSLWLIIPAHALQESDIHTVGTKTSSSCTTGIPLPHSRHLTLVSVAWSNLEYYSLPPPTLPPMAC